MALTIGVTIIYTRSEGKQVTHIKCVKAPVNQIINLKQ